MASVRSQDTNNSWNLRMLSFKFQSRPKDDLL